MPKFCAGMKMARIFVGRQNSIDVWHAALVVRMQDRWRQNRNHATSMCVVWCLSHQRWMCQGIVVWNLKLQRWHWNDREWCRLVRNSLCEKVWLLGRFEKLGTWEWRALLASKAIEFKQPDKRHIGIAKFEIERSFWAWMAESTPKVDW